ncbi:NAD(P)-binding Rossmann-fold superfamily protein [Zea mays]|uniref:NAD(P)-binding Rossmann-fold superfamily protein n=1 Tax=Zea mays TaxID=4577 RepID=A0A1D6JQV1_MAIZE|nr:NAD(P)-binding Rossmann-fold superfamily protein [Zea mays]
MVMLQMRHRCIEGRNFVLNMRNRSFLQIESHCRQQQIRCQSPLSTQLIERFNGRLPGYIGDGYDRESFCHVDDVVNGHIAAMEKGRVGQRYLLTGENMSFVLIFNMVANITNTRAPMFHVPLWLIEAYGWISVFVSRITGKLPLISYPTVRVLRHQWAYSCDKAKMELGYTPRNLTEGLSEMLLWLKEEKLIKF